jgi:hypothetical protein
MSPHVSRCRMARRHTIGLGIVLAAGTLVLLPLLASAAPIYYVTAPYTGGAPLIGLTATASTACSSYTIAVPPTFSVGTGITTENVLASVAATSTCPGGYAFTQAYAGVQGLVYKYSATSASYLVTMSWKLTANVQLANVCAAPATATALDTVLLNGSMTDYTTVPPAIIGSGTTTANAHTAAACGTGWSWTPSNQVFTVTFPVTLTSGHTYHLSTAAWATCEAKLASGVAGDYSHADCDMGTHGSAVLSFVQIQ